MAGHLRAADVVLTRVPDSRWVLIGLKGYGYAKLRPAEAAELAQALWSLCGYDGTPERIN